MTPIDFINKNHTEYHCYAVHSSPDTDGCIERDLIIDDKVLYNLDNKPYIHINNFHSTVLLADITDVIVTNTRWTSKEALAISDTTSG